MKKIWDYFKNSVDYPRILTGEILPFDEVWMYVSYCFLNAFINYVKPIKIYSIGRYTPDEELIEYGKEKLTKKELRDKIIANEIKEYHTELNCLRDDIVVLARIEDSGDYIFFYFDMDVSDCSIGRIKTEDSQNGIVQSVINWLEDEKNKNKGKSFEKNMDNGIINYYELPNSFFRGWVGYFK